jgi:CubicO group peptidase (beta-lactamase class C family)
VGYGLLASRAGHRYTELIERRITGPLGMRDTRMVPTPDMTRREAVGHDADLTPSPHWDMGALDSAGSLRSTANDLLRLLQGFLGYRRTDLAHAMKAMLATRRPGGQPPSQHTALGWNIYVDGSQEIVWKNGSVGGYRAFIGYDLEARVGVVALANAQTAVGVDDLGMHLLDPRLPVDLDVPRVHNEIAVDPEILDRYVGRYRFSATDILTVSRDGSQLYGQEPGPDRFPLFPEAAREFFLKLVDAQITFVVDQTGRASAAIWHQGGQDQRGERME